MQQARASLALTLALWSSACTPGHSPKPVERERPASVQSPRETKPATAAARQPATEAEPRPERVRYDTTRVRRLLAAPFSEWTDDDKVWAEAIGVKAMLGEFGIADRKRLGTDLYAKWFEHANGRVTREEQQTIAERIASEMPEEFSVHVVGVEAGDGGFAVTLKPEVQDVWWSIDCNTKRDMLAELVEQWRTALHAAQDAKGTERGMIDVTVRTERAGVLAQWNEVTGADIFPLARCR